MAAACDLADRGHPVVLMEKRPFLGGMAFSFPDPDAGREIDNGQHVFLGCCTAYVSFLEKLGVLHNTHIPPDLNVPILGYPGRKGVLRSANLPAPFHPVPSLMRYPYLSWVEKLRVLYGGLCIYLTRRQRDSVRLDLETFSAWLKRHRQTDAAIARFWNLIVLPTLNDDVSEVSADMGLMVFQEGVLRSRESAGIGYAKVGLSELVSEAAGDYLASRGERRCWAPEPGRSRWRATGYAASGRPAGPWRATGTSPPCHPTTSSPCCRSLWQMGTSSHGPRGCHTRPSWTCILVRPPGYG